MLTGQFWPQEEKNHGYTGNPLFSLDNIIMWFYTGMNAFLYMFTFVPGA